MKFITVTTKDVGANGLPKLFAINIAHIVTVEPVLWELKHDGIDLDAPPAILEGTNIVINVNQAHVIQVESRDPFDNVLKMIEWADGTVENRGDAADFIPEDMRPDVPPTVEGRPCAGCGAHPGHKHGAFCQWAFKDTGPQA